MIGACSALLEAVIGTKASMTKGIWIDDSEVDQELLQTGRKLYALDGQKPKGIDLFDGDDAFRAF